MRVEVQYGLRDEVSGLQWREDSMCIGYQSELRGTERGTGGRTVGFQSENTMAFAEVDANGSVFLLLTCLLV